MDIVAIVAAFGVFYAGSGVTNRYREDEDELEEEEDETKKTDKKRREKKKTVNCTQFSK